MCRLRCQNGVTKPFLAFRTSLSYVVCTFTMIHRFRRNSVSLRSRRESRLKILWSEVLCVNSGGTQTSCSLLRSGDFRRFKTVWWWMQNYHSHLHDILPPSLRNNFISLFLWLIGGPEDPFLKTIALLTAHIFLKHKLGKILKYSKSSRKFHSPWRCFIWSLN